MGERVLPGVLSEVSVHTPALLFTADAAGRVDSVNARWAAFIGTQAAELLGSGWIRFVHPDDVARVLSVWSQRLADGEPFATQTGASGGAMERTAGWRFTPRRNATPPAGSRAGSDRAPMSTLSTVRSKRWTFSLKAV